MLYGLHLNYGTAREGWIYSDGRLVAGREATISGSTCVIKTAIVNEIISATFVADDTNFYEYLNGELKKTVAATIDISNEKLLFNKRTGYGDNDWYIIRVYDRALTSEEVIKNNEVDKERFGL